MKKKYAIVAGFPKCASTSIFNYLKNHPDISPTKEKEINFFHSKEIENQSQNEIISEYSKFFSAPKHDDICLDGSVTYSKSESTIKKISDAIRNDVKIIISTRDPIYRMYSQYQMMIRNEKIAPDLPFIKYIKGLAENNFSIHPEGKTVIDQGLYHQKYQMFLKYFDKDSIMICELEELLKNPKQQMLKVCDFLGISQEYFDQFTFHHHNISTEHRSPIYRVYDRLKRFFRINVPFIHRTLSNIYFLFTDKADIVPRIEKSKSKPEISSEAIDFLKSFYGEDSKQAKQELGIGKDWETI